MPSHPKASELLPLEPDFVAALKSMWLEQIVFNRVLGLQLADIGPEHASATLEMRPELIGHFTHQRIHGGVISATLDAMGGVALMGALGARHRDETVAQRMQRFGKLGTIDLRVDYLRPGVGARFRLSAEVVRLGSRVGTTRMEFCAEDGKLLAIGTAAYMVS